MGEQPSETTPIKGGGDKKDKIQPSVPYRKLFRYATAWDWLYIVLGTIGGLGNGAALPIWAVLFGDLVNTFGASPDGFMDEIIKLSMSFFYLALGSFVASYMQMAMWMWVGSRQARAIRIRFLKSVLDQDIQFFDTDSSTGSLLTGMNEDSVMLEQSMGEKVGTFIFNMGMFASGLTVAFIYGWDLTLIMLAILPLLGGSVALLFKIMNETTEKSQEAYSEANTIAQQALSSIRTVYSFNAEAMTKKAYTSKLDVPEKMGLKQSLWMGVVLGSFQFIMFGAYAAALWYAAWRVRAGTYDGGRVMTVFFSALIGGFSVGQASPSISAFQSGCTAGARLFSVIDRVPAIDPKAKGKKIKDLKGEVSLQNVSFAYPSRPELKVFNGITLTAKAGTTVALVGQSGSGKSTIVSLVERFYDPISGTVCLDGVPLTELDLTWLRDQVGLVSQEPTLFATTIYDNIAYGRPGATEEEVYNAARSSNAHDFISSLPKGYKTTVGEGGVQLSGGQKQRVAIARALLKDPKVLLLDEATSALDAQSERLVQDALEKLMSGRTTLVVAHRLSTIRNANHICVLNDGILVEEGSHSHLLQNPNGAYAQLVALQQTSHSADDLSGPSMGSAAFAEAQAQDPQDSVTHHLDNDHSDEHKDVGAYCCGLFKKNKKQVNDEENPADSDESAHTKAPGMGRLLALNSKEWPLLVVGILGSAGLGCTMPLFAVALSSIIAVFFEPDPVKQKQAADLWSLIFAMVGVGSFLCTLAQQACFGIMGSRLATRVRTLLFDTMLKQEVGWFDRDENNSGALTGTLGTDAALVRGAVGDTMGLMVQNLFTFGAGFTIAFINGWQMTLVILGAVPLIVFAGLIQAKIGTGFSEGASKETADADQIATEAFRNIRVVQAFNLQDSVEGLWEQFSTADAVGKAKRAHVTGIGFGFSQFAMFGIYGLAFWYGGTRVVAGQMDLEQMLKVFFAVLMGAMGAGNAQMAFPNADKAGAAVKRVFAIVDRIPKINPNSETTPPKAGMEGSISLESVRFVYPSRPNVTVLHKMDLEVETGKMVALVGESGSGKSTIVGLVERFYDALGGAVRIDGIDLRQLPLAWVRDHIGLVSQEPTLFALTVKENIILGRPNATDEEVKAAAAAANAAGFIERLPEGYDTYVGERGVQLSGGQKQRVAIARAVLKDPRVLLLDEATSALDAESERLVQDALEKLMQGRTTIVVAHRLSTIRRADTIAVMNKGQIVEQGTHDELLTTKPDGAYARLIRLQQSAGAS
eukprot:CAMPEP_0117691884 /NCGR_PEP_ID=MMETSP0804-20121206/25998_1 /TAXON_ID=1074897 /ORGANISM="Tetraselmis astigmatica, Strain CCMP880" /LENGTH=1263 /DNA_ID=CAMNT_0005505227 /DNA_START=142 /DNA_END=3933 /DNA_ORIENTATION=+